MARGISFGRATRGEQNGWMQYGPPCPPSGFDYCEEEHYHEATDRVCVAVPHCSLDDSEACPINGSGGEEEQ